MKTKKSKIKIKKIYIYLYVCVCVCMCNKRSVLDSPLNSGCSGDAFIFYKDFGQDCPFLRLVCGVAWQ
jgi:hypothetical protein